MVQTPLEYTGETNLKPYQFDPQIIHEWDSAVGAGSLNFSDAPTRIEQLSLPDLWLRVALVGNDMVTLVLGEAYSGSDIAIVCCFRSEAAIVRCLANARAIVFDDELAAMM